jgi:hypothetical protein
MINDVASVVHLVLLDHVAILDDVGPLDLVCLANVDHVVAMVLDLDISEDMVPDKTVDKDLDMMVGSLVDKTEDTELDS